MPGYDLWLGVWDVLTGDTAAARVMALLFFAGALYLTWLTWKRLPSEYALFMVAMILLVLSRHDRTGRPLLSFSRHALLLFPGFMALADRVRGSSTRRSLAYAMAASNVFLLGIFFMWGFSE